MQIQRRRWRARFSAPSRLAIQPVGRLRNTRESPYTATVAPIAVCETSKDWAYNGRTGITAPNPSWLTAISTHIHASTRRSFKCLRFGWFGRAEVAKSPNCVGCRSVTGRHHSVVEARPLDKAGSTVRIRAPKHASWSPIRVRISSHDRTWWHMAESTFYTDHWQQIEDERVERYERMFAWRDGHAVLLAPLGLRPGSRVLDYGCGPGFMALGMAGLVGSTGRVTASTSTPVLLPMRLVVAKLPATFPTIALRTAEFRL